MTERQKDMEVTIGLSDLSDTERLARHLAQALDPGDIILLSGNLGTGKTAFTKALAQALGVPARRITSPSFGLLHHYPEAEIPLVHVDLYRMGHDADPGAIGLDEYLDNLHIVVIEWANYLMSGLKWTKQALTLHLDWIDQDRRQATLRTQEENWMQRIKGLMPVIHKNLTGNRKHDKRSGP